MMYDDHIKTGDTEMEHDKNLIKQVHHETSNDGCFFISAILTRFGGLAVFVYSTVDMKVLWQGENILEARKWIKK